MPVCLQILGNDLYLNLLVTLIIALVTFVLAYLAGLVTEHYFDLIKGKDRRKNGLNKRYGVALDCIQQAEQALPGSGLGRERFAQALDLYQEKMGRRSLDDEAIVQTMFNMSVLSH